MNLKNIIPSSIVALSILAGCATMERIDENFTEKTPGFSKIYSSAKKNCLEKAGLAINDLGTSVESVENDRLISNRWEFMRMAESVATHSQYSSQATAVQYSIAAKLYVDVKEAGRNQCQVKLVRVRAWENTSEYEELNVTQVMKLITVPFFKNLDERLAK